MPGISPWSFHLQSFNYSSGQSNSLHFALLIDNLHYFVFMIMILVYKRAEHKLGILNSLCILSCSIYVNYCYGLARPVTVRYQNLCIYWDYSLISFLIMENKMSNMYNLHVSLTNVHNQLLTQLRTFRITLNTTVNRVSSVFEQFIWVD